jgi:hypothetical protein
MISVYDMCYALYLSTSSKENLSELNSDLVRFAQIGDDEERAMSLLHSQKWYVGSKSGCSCHFRHLGSTELGFGEPVDWYPEEDDDILATAELYKVILRLVSEGNQVDCQDLWEGLERGEVKMVVVDLKTVPEGAFRFFENHHFVFEG